MESVLGASPEKQGDLGARNLSRHHRTWVRSLILTQLSSAALDMSLNHSRPGFPYLHSKGLN